MTTLAMIRPARAPARINLPPLGLATANTVQKAYAKSGRFGYAEQMNLRTLFAVALAAVTVGPAVAQTPPMTPDIATRFEFPKAGFDYVKREAMVPMRDGVKLYTVMIIPKGAKDAPILLTRTPYNAKKSASRNVSIHAAATGSQMDEPF